MKCLIVYLEIFFKLLSTIIFCHSGPIELQIAGGLTLMEQAVLVVENKKILEHALILRSMVMAILNRQQQ